MSEISKEFNRFLEENKISIPDISRSSGINQQVLYNIRNNTSKPRIGTEESLRLFMEKYEAHLGYDNSASNEAINDTKPHYQMNLSDIINKYKKDLASDLGIDIAKIEIIIKS